MSSAKRLPSHSFCLYDSQQQTVVPPLSSGEGTPFCSCHWLDGADGV